VAQLTGGFLCSNDYLMMPSSIVKLASENLALRRPVFQRADVRNVAGGQAADDER
jgi:hypothetical protein